MSVETTPCPRCSLYRGEVALLRAEIAGLRRAVLALTRSSSGDTPTLEITGMDEAQRLALAAPVADGPDLYSQVTVVHRDQLTARCMVPVEDPSAFVGFFQDLAQHSAGWEGEKQLTAGAGQFAITCRYEGKTYRPEVSMDVYCALDDPSLDPYWAVHLHLDVAPEALGELASQAEMLFGSAGSDRSGAAGSSPAE